jgi:hypothetical protein
LICVGAGEEQARKVYALWGLRGVERQVGLTRGTRWLAGSSAGCMVARKARRSCGQEPVQGSGSRLESTCGICGGSPQNCRVTWLSHKTKTGGSAGGDGIRTRRDALKRKTRVGVARLASRLSEVRSSGTRRWCYDDNSPSAPQGCVSLYYVIWVVSSFGYLHIYLEERGWQPSLETLAHLLSHFPFLFSLEFSIGLACMNLFGMYR